MKSLLDPEDNPGLFSGPLHPYMGIYELSLKNQGYKRPTLYTDLLLFADLDGWMKREGMDVRELTQRELGRFLSYHMRTRRTRRRPKQAALGRLLGLLRKMGATAAAARIRPTPIERKVSEFTEHLRLECGYAATTIARHRLTICRFLSEIYGKQSLELRALKSAAVLDFIRHYVKRFGRSSAQGMTSALRNFFRFLRQRGELEADLASNVPSVAGWALDSLPRHLPRGAIERVLTAQERTSHVGRRNHAILLLLARLGLRSCEVAALRLDDLDWENGCVNVRSNKGRRTIALPLPKDVGHALADYLKRGRPRCACREVFVRNQAPMVGVTRMGICGVAREALRRSGMTGVSMGAHTFRHTLATDLLRRGASLDEIGRILRHKDASTTAIYAKVDTATLRPLALRWPGGAV